MALQNHPSLYHAGDVVVNTQQPINLYAQHLQRKQAREEALDQYEMNRMNRMNEQGVRDKDREGLDQRVLDMKTFYQANKDKIRKGGTPEAYNYEKMFRDTLGGINKSKDATARGLTTYKLIQERRKLGRNTPDDMFEEYTQMEETPVWDEKYTPFDIMKWNANTSARYDSQAALKKGYGDLKRNQQTVRYEDIPGDKYTRNKFIDAKFDDEALEIIHERATGEYDREDGFVEEVQRDIANPVRKLQLEKVFTDAYKVPPQSQSDYAVAKRLSELQLTQSNKPVKEEKWEDRRRLLNDFAMGRIAAINWYRQQDKGMQDFYIDSIIADNLEEGGRKGGEFSASPLVLKQLGQYGLPAEGMKVTPDGNYEYKFDGKWIPLSANTYKAMLRDIFQAKAGAQEINKANKKDKPVTKKGELD